MKYEPMIHCAHCQYYAQIGLNSDPEKSYGVCQKYDYPVTGLMCCWWVKKFIKKET